MNKTVKELIEAAWFAGFNSSGEGYNGEHRTEALWDNPPKDAAAYAARIATHEAPVGQSENLGVLPDGFFAGLLNDETDHDAFPERHPRIYLHPDKDYISIGFINPVGHDTLLQMPRVPEAWGDHAVAVEWVGKVKALLERPPRHPNLPPPGHVIPEHTAASDCGSAHQGKPEPHYFDPQLNPRSPVPVQQDEPEGVCAFPNCSCTENRCPGVGGEPCRGCGVPTGIGAYHHIGCRTPEPPPSTDPRPVPSVPVGGERAWVLRCKDCGEQWAAKDSRSLGLHCPVCEGEVETHKAPVPVGVAEERQAVDALLSKWESLDGPDEPAKGAARPDTMVGCGVCCQSWPAGTMPPCGLADCPWDGDPPPAVPSAGLRDRLARAFYDRDVAEIGRESMRDYATDRDIYLGLADCALSVLHEAGTQEDGGLVHSLAVALMTATTEAQEGIKPSDEALRHRDALVRRARAAGEGQRQRREMFDMFAPAEPTIDDLQRSPAEAGTQEPRGHDEGAGEALTVALRAGQRRHILERLTENGWALVRFAPAGTRTQEDWTEEWRVVWADKLTPTSCSRSAWSGSPDFIEVVRAKNPDDRIARFEHRFVGPASAVSGTPDTKEDEL